MALVGSSSRQILVVLGAQAGVGGITVWNAVVACAQVGEKLISGPKRIATLSASKKHDHKAQYF